MPEPEFVVNPVIVEDICNRAAQGLFPVDAARQQGVPPHRWKRWWAKGKSDYNRDLDTPYADLYRRVQKSHSSFVDQVELTFFERFLTVDNKGGGAYDWRAFAWYLPRARPERWGEAVAQGAGSISDEAQGMVDRITAGRESLDQEGEGAVEEDT